MPRVLYERDGRIARVTLNRPEALNAIDAELPAELEDAVARANADLRRARDRAVGRGRRRSAPATTLPVTRESRRHERRRAGDAVGPDASTTP